MSRKARAKPTKKQHRVLQRGQDAVAGEAAISDILRVISSSPDDLEPVFDTILAHTIRLCEGVVAMLWQFDRQKLRFAAHRNATVEAVAYCREHPLELGTYNPTPQAALERRIVQVLDVFANPNYRPLIPVGTSGKRPNAGTVLAVPLVREDELFGVITIWRYEKRPFSERQIELVKTFTAQAVIAMQNVRLFNETRDALERQTATGEVLRVISESQTDTQPVFEAIVRSAVRLCAGIRGSLVRVDGDTLRLWAHFNYNDEAMKIVSSRYPAPLSEHSMVALAARSGEVVHSPDTLNDSRSRVTSLTSSLDIRAQVSVPLLREGTAVGVLNVFRSVPGPFTDAQISVLRTFADQAVIAIENVRLFKETKESLERQTATADILRVISGSPASVQPVFEAILDNATRLCEAHLGALFLVENDVWNMVSHRGTSLEAAGFYRNFRVGPNTGLGRMTKHRQPVHIEDLLADAATSERDPLRIATIEKLGARTFLAVPLLKDASVLGAVVIYRQEVRPFEDAQIRLLSTFADQAVIAIENVRLFNETKEALERQTASAEVLRVISGTPADAQPVFDAIAQSALRVFKVSHVGINVVEGDVIKVKATGGSHDPRGEFSIPLDRNSTAGRSVLDRALIEVDDTESPDAATFTRDSGRLVGFRAIATAPMLREGTAVGSVSMMRGEPGLFSVKQLELLQTFADQAAIAIQNARLFREIQEKSAQLELANKHKSDFLANMSHELRTPLNAIIGFSEALIERMFGEVNEKQADYLKDIHESGRHLLSLINDILDLSKIEAGRMDLELSNFHLPSALSNAMTLIRERAQRHAIELGLEVDQRLGEFQADERKFKQIMLNLLSNAVKFTPDGGRVDVCATKDTDKIEIAVKDTGIGIAPEDQTAVFEEFKQVGRDQMRKSEGTGLGLALTKRFVELHGGAIRLESTPGKGSTFTVSLPFRAG